MQFKGLTFGIPKEIMHGERRVAAIPETVKKLVAGGAEVLVEKARVKVRIFPMRNIQTPVPG